MDKKMVKQTTWETIFHVTLTLHVLYRSARDEYQLGKVKQQDATQTKTLLRKHNSKKRDFIKPPLENETPVQILMQQPDEEGIVMYNVKTVESPHISGWIYAINVVPNDTVCPICLANLNMSDTIKTCLCGHKFHNTCIDSWLQRDTRCPVCRRENVCASSRELQSTTTNTDDTMVIQDDDIMVIQYDSNDLYNDRFNQVWGITNPPPNPRWLPVPLSSLAPGTHYSYWASDGTIRHGVKR